MKGFFFEKPCGLLRLKVYLVIIGLTVLKGSSGFAESKMFWLKIKATSSAERTLIANTGASIEEVAEDYVVALGRQKQYDLFLKEKNLIAGFELTPEMLDFPPEDKNFHTYDQVEQSVKDLAQKNSDLISLEKIGSSLEGRTIYDLRISGNLTNSSQLPGIVFMGTHHAREHLSTEVPLMLANHLIAEFRKGTPRIVSLLKSREIHIIPLVNPDGVVFDVTGSTYHMWRKNRRANGNGTVGVDLNRNYSWGFGGPGSSSDPDDETYHGPSAFSEPETQAIKNFVDGHKNLTILLTFHTFSELILYPWGGTTNSIQNAKDLKVFETLATTMSKWNGYTPEQASQLYVASGDTTDWAYGTHGIFAFTFEMDPKNMWDGGFYPGQSFIPIVFKKNLEPCLFLIDYADNPYRVLSGSFERIGFRTPLFQ